MGEWISVSTELPWLPPRPYFVVPSDKRRLETDLRARGFGLVEADASECTDERKLLTELGDVLEFPDYYGRNWAAFGDCMSDLVGAGQGAVALVVVGIDVLLRSNVHAFARSVHLLMESVTDIERARPDDFQFEVFFVGAFDVRADV